MKQALALARKGTGQVSPNPAVGALLVRGSTIVGRGYHRRAGGDHAEIHALRQAGEKATGSTLYVTLEPCCFQGKTPPCTQAILAAGVSRLIYGMEDPNPRVSGKGIAVLREKGVRISGPVLEPECRAINQPFIKFHQTGLPHVRAKWAMSLDGKIASSSGDSKWISSPDSRKKVHRMRAELDAIAVGVGTVLADDPMLTARISGPVRQPVRIIFDSTARTPLSSNLVRTSEETPVCIVVTRHAPMRKVSALRDAGCRILSAQSKNGRVSVKDTLRKLGRQNIQSLLVEGGSAVLGDFFDRKAVDASTVFISSDIVGGEKALTPVGGLGNRRIRTKLCPIDWSVCRKDRNIIVDSVYRKY